MKLYEKWWEDRQDFVENLAQHAKLLKLFIEQVLRFKELEGHVRQSLVKSVQESTKNVEQELGNKLHEMTTHQVNNTVEKLNDATRKAIQVMQNYQTEQQQNQWKTMGIAIITAIAASVFSVWLVMPKPMLPFTQDTLTTYIDGTFIEQVWPKLPAKMRQSINDIAVKDFNREAPSSLLHSGNTDEVKTSSD